MPAQNVAFRSSRRYTKRRRLGGSQVAFARRVLRHNQERWAKRISQKPARDEFLAL